jgi:hypothetical protein
MGSLWDEIGEIEPCRNAMPEVTDIDDAVIKAAYSRVSWKIPASEV